MSKFRNYLLFIAVLAIAAAIIGSRARAWKEPEKEVRPVMINISDIAKNPLALKDKKVTFISRFAARGNMFKEKDEIFTPDQFENFSVWNNDIKFWKEKELNKVYPTLYLSKTNTKLINELRIINQFEKIEITGVVESLYANMPWIKVTDIRILKEDDLDQSMASQVARAIKFIDNNEFQKAKICFEIARERRVPLYVNELIENKLTEISSIMAEREIENKRQAARTILDNARNLAKSKDYSKAAVTYGKALKVSDEFNTSADIHKEIAGFFIDFYKTNGDMSLLEYSINEFKIAQNLLHTPDSDILYALAYIEMLKAKVTHDYNKAELIARQCLKINEHHYNGRKLLAEIMSCELTANKDKSQEIILPVAPKKRIKFTSKPEMSDNNDIKLQIDDMINEKELIALEKQMNKTSETLAEDRNTLINKEDSNRISQAPVFKEKIPGINAENFDQILQEMESDMNVINVEDDSITQNYEPELPDFPVDTTQDNASHLPNLAL